MSCLTPSTKSPGSSVHGIFQARTLDWVAISSSRESSWPKDGILVSLIGRRILYHWATWESLNVSTGRKIMIFVWEMILSEKFLYRYFSKVCDFFKIKIQLKSNTASSASLLNWFPLLMSEYPLSIIQRKWISFIHILSKGLLFSPLNINLFIWLCWVLVVACGI